ncbi:MAG: hypothetical protein P8M78_00140 [Myxococcota bacterium]|nr:hypothetical protein [Myxococcota bacterium]
MEISTIGLDPNRVGRRVGQRLAVIFAVACVVSGSAMASEVVDLRIGAHPDFTRIVFELDRPTGYRIERAQGADGGPELVVSLDANSIPRKVHSQKSLIGLIRITPEGQGSVAHIALNRDGLKLKEMILANPPRIVLDVLGAKSASVAPPPVVVAKPRAPQAPKASTPAKPKPKMAAKPAPTQVASAVEGQTAQVSPRPASKAPSPIEPRVAPVAAAGRAAVPPTALIEGVIIEEPSEGGLPGMGASMRGDLDEASEGGLTTRSASERLVRLEADSIAPPFEPSVEEEGMGTGTVAFLVALVILVAAGVVYLRRRGEIETTGTESDDFQSPGPSANPFSEITETEDFAAEVANPGISEPLGAAHLGDEEQGSSARSFDVPDPDPDYEDDDKPVEPVDEPLIGYSLGQSLADSGSANPGSSPLASSASAGGATASPDFEGRVSELESRLEEARDARERLERQVAAQTEELRVQRAAIARTQRAVRNLNRNGEEAPTEPALRDPQT